MRPLGKVKIAWSAKFAYAIGLIATDGNLSKDGRHIEFTSKDLQLIETFMKCLDLKDIKIGKKGNGQSKEKKYYHVQFGDVLFYRFLLSIGLMPAKSKILSSMHIPKIYFSDFLRGCIDGDGSISTNTHPESKHLQLKVYLTSASKNFLLWVKECIITYFNIETGYMRYSARVFVLSYGKSDSIKLFAKLYYNTQVPCLERKLNIARDYFIIDGPTS